MDNIEGSSSWWTAYEKSQKRKASLNRSTEGMWNAKRNLKLNINQEEEGRQIFSTQWTSLKARWCLYVLIFPSLLSNSSFLFEILLDCMCYLYFPLPFLSCLFDDDKGEEIYSHVSRVFSLYMWEHGFMYCTS